MPGGGSAPTEAEQVKLDASRFNVRVPVQLFIQPHQRLFHPGFDTGFTTAGRLPVGRIRRTLSGPDTLYIVFQVQVAVHRPAGVEGMQQGNIAPCIAVAAAFAAAAQGAERSVALIVAGAVEKDAHAHNDRTG